MGPVRPEAMGRPEPAKAEPSAAAMALNSLVVATIETASARHRSASRLVGLVDYPASQRAFPTCRVPGKREPPVKLLAFKIAR